MFVFLLFIAVIQVGSLLFCFLAIKRVKSYVRSYKFEESPQTLLFGIIPLSLIRFFYLAYVSSFIVVSTWMILMLSEISLNFS